MREYIVQAIAQETIACFEVHNAPEIIRCKNCEHYDKDMIYCNKFGIQSIDGEWFCADGEKRNEEQQL